MQKISIEHAHTLETVKERIQLLARNNGFRLEWEEWNFHGTSMGITIKGCVEQACVSVSLEGEMELMAKGMIENALRNLLR